jgi:hypothetical protein
VSEKEILEVLEAIVQLLLPPAVEGGRETDESRILRLCDFDHTREQIAKAINKPLNRVDVVLNSLRKNGRIKSLPRGGNTVYIRVRRNP